VGILGLVPLAAFTLAGLWRLVRSRLLVGDARLWAIGTAVYVVAISFINPTIQQPGTPQVALTVLVLGVASVRRAPLPGDERAHLHRVPGYAQARQEAPTAA
jgi:hypothetical protein